MYYVYILESPEAKWYYGYSENIAQRLIDHNSNRSKYTRFKGPWTLVFLREFDNKNKALKFEQYLKKSRNKTFIKSNFQEYFLE